MKKKYGKFIIVSCLTLFSVVMFISFFMIRHNEKKRIYYSYALEDLISSKTMKSFNSIKFIKLSEYDYDESSKTFKKKNSKYDLCDEYIEYDKKGNVIERWHTNYKHIIKKIDKYEYDSKGNNISIFEYDDYGSRLVLNNKIIKSYNKKGNMIELLSYKILPYSREDFLTSEIHYQYKYNFIGKVIEYNSDHEFILFTIIRYDWVGRVIEICQYDEHNFLSEKRITKFNRNVVIEQTYDSRGNLKDIFTHKFNGKQQLIEYTTNFVSEDTTYYKYNKNGDVIEKYDHDGIFDSVHKYRYEYDNKKNWIKRTEFIDNEYQNNEPESMVVREIIYY